MRISTLIIAVGLVLFVLPVPGTFVLGGAAVVLGGFVRWLGA